MSRTNLLSAIPLLTALGVAGCGSSSSHSYSAPAKPAAASAAAPAVITTKHDKLGTILAYGPKRLTVYLFEGDRGTTSSCSDACAAIWPPVTGKPSASGSAAGADLGTITRPDGSTQVTYKGHPLYLYSRDRDDGDAYGEGVNSYGAQWYVLAPSGKKVDKS